MTSDIIGFFGGIFTGMYLFQLSFLFIDLYIFDGDHFSTKKEVKLYLIPGFWLYDVIKRCYNKYKTLP